MSLLRLERYWHGSTAVVRRPEPCELRSIPEVRARRTLRPDIPSVGSPFSAMTVTADSDAYSVVVVAVVADDAAKCYWHWSMGSSVVVTCEHCGGDDRTRHCRTCTVVAAVGRGSRLGFAGRCVTVDHKARACPRRW